MGLERQRLMEGQGEGEGEGFSRLLGQHKSDIFSRLPVQDILHCMLVCKDWLRCIRNPSFYNMHLSRLQQTSPNPDYLLVCRGHSHGSEESEIFLVEHENHVSSTTTLPQKSLNDDLQLKGKGNLFIVGSFNGLVCLSSYVDSRVFYICNPITKEIVPLPKAPHHPVHHKGRYEYICGHAPPGFAFDTASETYKVVRAWCFVEQDLVRTRIDVYTLGGPYPIQKGRSSWRRIQDIPAPLSAYPSDKPTVFLQGALHWDMNNSVYHEEFTDCIGALDVATENFQVFKLPFQNTSTMHKTIGTLSDSLCVIVDFHDSIVLWTMKEYGVSKSWRQDYVIKKQTLVGPLKGLSFYHCRAAPVKNGRKYVLLLTMARNKGYYDLETGDFQPIELKGIPHDKPLDVFLHVASFISPRNPISTTTGLSPELLDQ